MSLMIISEFTREPQPLQPRGPEYRINADARTFCVSKSLQHLAVLISSRRGLSLPVPERTAFADGPLISSLATPLLPVVPFSSPNPMPSLFSRTRTNSTPNKKSTLPSDDSPYTGGGLDEFGRVSSRVSHRGATLGTPASKKDKKKEQKRSKALPPGREDAVYSPDSPFPDGAFLPLNLERPSADDGATDFIKGHDYGYLSYERHVVLGLDQVERLVEVISEELETRGGITTPFIFSTTALDISASSIRRIIRSFLATCANQSGASAQAAEGKWREEARFAGPHELAMCLRWGLARVIRSVGGQDVRGLVSWEHYVDFRESEAGR